MLAGDHRNEQQTNDLVFAKEPRLESAGELLESDRERVGLHRRPRGYHTSFGARSERGGPVRGAL